ncbi:PREDICTED: putative FBD-associated F-box protein At1g05080 [Camelina sativa]|uniref:FBD-associated F-box protein At1g05080 n=1 Tax=Camelina sativa TaxID=90675 RepID=A0ABM1QXL6_CAMSA|nr:PREDICTED: putative FBD-associated F-box protein At1g05080 [Camelina sativa]
MAEAKIEETVCEDRISVLPDDLLVKILDFLPTKDAVATMFLSKRWLSTWTMVTTLEYKDIDCESKKSVWWFLNKSFQLHKAPLIYSLRMELGPQCPTTDDVDIGKWVAKAVDCLVINLYIKLLWSAGPTSLHKSLYSCEYLADLTLSDQILVNVPSSSAYLPSLTDLELNRVVYKDEDSLVSLLSSCPVLEVLLVTRREDDNVKKFTVKVPTLWDLWYDNYSFGSSSNDVVDHTDGSLVVDAPAMTNCRITDFSGDSHSIEDMPCLRDAIINVESCYQDDKFLTSFSSVSSLYLYLSDAMVKFCTTINFSRLIKLSIFPFGPDWLTPLLLLLENAPKLKELLVDALIASQKDIYRPKHIPFAWNQPSPVPGCLSSQLEIFEWRAYGDRLEEEEFLTYILANSMRLKTATISLRLDLEDQELIIEELQDLPRVSPTSHLFFK